MTESATVSDLLSQARLRIGGEDAAREAALLLAHVTGLSTTRFRGWPEQRIEASQCRAFEALVTRRTAGEPVAHLIGEQGFWSLDLAVNRHTLIPRPDTECLVETALALRLPERARVLDLGTGTGAIALALASERPQWRIEACDSVPAAVDLARQNARRLALPIRVQRSHWFAQMPPQRYDLLISNPPYIAEDDHHLGEGDVRYEPASALVAGVDGLDAIRLLVADAPAWLAQRGWLVLEHGHDQGEAVRGLLRQRGFDKVQTRQDYAGRERLSLARQSEFTGPDGGNHHAQ